MCAACAMASWLLGWMNSLCCTCNYEQANRKTNNQRGGNEEKQRRTHCFFKSRLGEIYQAKSGEITASEKTCPQLDIDWVHTPEILTHEFSARREGSLYVLVVDSRCCLHFIEAVLVCPPKAGLVSITAGCGNMTCSSAILACFIGGCVCKHLLQP